MENKEKKTIKLSKVKHLDLFIVLFVVAVALTSVYVVLNAMGFLSYTNNYVAISPISDKNLPNYAEGMSCSLFFSGTTRDANVAAKRASEVYSDSLKNIYKRLDASNEYLDSPSIAQINDGIGHDVKVDSTIYNIVKDAYQRTSIDNNYSIFAQPLFDEWNDLISYAQSGHQERDPLNDDEEMNYLTELKNYINDSTNFNLEFKDNNTIKLSISEAYQNFRATNEINSPIISLNSLTGAYLVKEAAKSLEEAGFTDGYVLHNYGSGVTLKDYQSLNHRLYDVVNDDFHDFGYITIGGQYSFFKSYQINVSRILETEYYAIQKDGVTHYRSKHLNLKTGLPSEYHLEDVLFAEGYDVIDVTIEGLKVTSVTDNLEETAFINNRLVDKYAYLKNGEDKTVYIAESIKSQLTLYSEEYTSVTL